MSFSNTMMLITPFVTGALGLYFGARIYKIQRRYSFLERQLNELYSPILGLIKEIRAKSSIRHTISIKADEAWKEAIREWEEAGKVIERPNIELYKKIIDYDNKQLKEELIPQYQSILKLLTTNFSLADKETTDWYLIFCEYIEIWNRALTDSIPGAVIEKLEHSESKHNDFYTHIEERVNALREKLKPKSFWKRLF